MIMSHADTGRAIRAAITAAEAALAKADSLATAEFRKIVDPADLAKVQASYASAVKAVNALHRAAAKAKVRSDVIMPKFGK